MVTSPFLIAIFYITSIRTGISSPHGTVEALIYRVFVLNTEDNISSVAIRRRGRVKLWSVICNGCNSGILGG